MASPIEQYAQSWESGFKRLDALLGAQVSEELHQQAVRRLEVVAWAALAAQLGAWLVINLAQGTLAQEFDTPLDWGFPAGVIVASLAIVAVIRSGRLPSAAIVRLGLVYQVVISFGIAAGTYMSAFRGIPADAFTFDRVGLTFVAPWMVLFSVLVPSRPREALLALFASATAVPVAYLVQVPSGLAPALPAGTFALIFVFPHLVVVGLSYTASRVVHRLGVEVRRAYELGSYQLVGLLGRGGMGEVWRASHRTLARPAAIKLIRPEALGDDPVVATARFEREAQAIASLQSPNTVALYDFGATPDGTLYYVMELLDGVDLEQLVRDHGPLPLERVIHILRQVCASLAEAHARDIIHRDIKPANIYLCRRALEHDVVKVLDFGLVKRLADAAPDVQLTHPEVVAGTPAYLAPEIVTGGVVDGRADLYALGCVAFWLLTGRLVFQGRTAAALIVAHAREAPPRPGGLVEIPEALDRIVLDCLAKDPAARPANAEVLSERLAAVPLARPWTPAAAAAWWAGQAALSR
ncbi:MAG TPA: serine/threonine-protein kinase [Gemmatimonadales bacterium]|nr:serine/threonine-protein kinase [Gemmatimonadales bacterium]